jgi:hypothetical protein
MDELNIEPIGQPKTLAEDLAAGFGLNVGSNDKDGEQTSKVKRHKFELKQELMESPAGISHLYKKFVLPEDKKLKGKGHELSDFNKLMTGVKDWHN